MDVKKIRITESQYNLIENSQPVQQNLFPDDKVTPSEEEKYYDKKNKKKERYEKNKIKRKEKKESEKKKMDKMHAIARGTGKDLFGNEYSKKEKDEAEKYIKSKIKK